MKLTYTLIGLLVTAGAVVGLMLICGKERNDEDKPNAQAERKSADCADLRKRAAAIFRRFG
jgi:hypothetical protein